MVWWGVGLGLKEKQMSNEDIELEINTPDLSPDAQGVMAQLKAKQKIISGAIDDIREAEKAYLDAITKITNNVLVNPRWTSICKTHAQEGTMAMIRAISRPEEKS